MSQAGVPFIDIHTHIGHIPGVVGEVFTPEDLLYIADHEGARFTLVSSASTTTIGQHVGTNEAVEMVKRYGDRLGALLWINPHDPTWPEDVELAEKHGFYGIKLHPPLDHYLVDRATLDPIFECARQHHWPILIHVETDGTPYSAWKYEPLIQAYPDVKLVLAHLRTETITLVKRYDNVYADTTYMPAYIVEVGVDALGPDKILFGSDACEGFDVGHAVGRARPPRSYALLIQGLRERGIADAALEKILYRNAQLVFGIKK